MPQSRARRIGWFCFAPLVWLAAPLRGPRGDLGKTGVEPVAERVSLPGCAGLNLDGFVGGPGKAQADIPAVVFERVKDATIRKSRAQPGTRASLKVKGPRSRHIYLVGNELHQVRSRYQVDADVEEGAVREAGDW